MAATLFTIGYQGRSAKALSEALVEAGVTRLIDVRARAWSHRPEFRKQALKAELERHGIEYVHCKEAGNPFRPKLGEPLDWKRCSTLYKQHLKASPGVVEAVVGLTKTRRSALFCYEAATSDCHRGELVRAIANDQAVKVIDL